MNKRRQRILVGMACIGAVFLFLLGRMDAKAGFGDFNDYDSGGYDGGYSNDYGSYSSSSDSWYYDYSGSSGSGSSFTATVVVFVIIVLAIYETRQRSKFRSQGTPSASPAQRQNGNRRLPDRTDEISRVIQERDPMFTAPDFLSFAKQVYMDIQAAWERRDLTPVRGVLHQNLYQQTQRQIQKKIEDGIVNHLERISVNTAYLTSYRRDKDYEYLTIYMAASMIDYQVKEATGEIILGNKTTRWNMYYKMTFMRSKESKTGSAKEQERGFVCPNCGAPLKGTSFGKCEYCDSVVTTGVYSWVLCDFGVVKDDTVDEGIKLS